MSKIIQFPTNRIQHTNGYNNLMGLFQICDTEESCVFYRETAKNLYSKDKITESEISELRIKGMDTLIKLRNEKRTKQVANNPGTYLYTPEMNQDEPEGCEIKAGRCYYGRHYWLKTKLELKGRGITRNEPTRDGYNSYTVTELAYEKLEKQYRISYESNLD